MPRRKQPKRLARAKSLNSQRPRRLHQRMVRAQVVKIIRRHVGYFNGWKVDDETEYLDCLDAAYDILAYLKRKKLLRPNAALCEVADERRPD